MRFVRRVTNSFIKKWVKAKYREILRFSPTLEKMYDKQEFKYT